MEIDKVVGKKVTGLFMNEEKTLMFLVFTQDENIALVAESDCCSESWFNHVSGISRLVGGTISAVEEISLGEATGTRQEVDELYSLKIMTEKGVCDVEMRNSSNGYYGGSIEVMDHFKASDYKLLEIMEDF